MRDRHRSHRCRKWRSLLDPGRVLRPDGLFGRAHDPRRVLAG